MSDGFSPRSIAEARYMLEDCHQMFPGWVYSFRTRKQWMPPYTTIRVRPKKHLHLKIMDVHMSYVLVGVCEEAYA